jgi:hypothetical protein
MRDADWKYDRDQLYAKLDPRFSIDARRNAKYACKHIARTGKVLIIPNPELPAFPSNVGLLRYLDMHPWVRIRPRGHHTDELMTVEFVSFISPETDPPIASAIYAELRAILSRLDVHHRLEHIRYYAQYLSSRRAASRKVFGVAREIEKLAQELYALAKELEA